MRKLNKKCFLQVQQVPLADSLQCGEDVGVWKRRFPCLDMTLQIKTTSVPIVITACAALHNFSHLLREPIPPPPQSQENHDSGSPAPTSPAPPRPPAMPPVPDTASGFRMRERIVTQYFA
ncbi:hypothetical protein HPB49_025829 [Dermacentor silvarum]|nr:hypothetical protein HPB49_025829 [Dermacentor silvarum]